MERVLPRPLDWRLPRWWVLHVVGMGVLLAYWWVTPGTGIDAQSYHLVEPSNPYYGQWNGGRAFVYSPLAAQTIYPLTLLPLEVFGKILLTANLLAMAWLVTPVGAAMALAFDPIRSELMVGNIHTLLAAALVVGMTRPAVWSFALLTKVTPGVGLLWFAARREWRALGIALGVTIGLVVISALVSPGAWVDWFTILSRAPGQPPPEFVLSDLSVAVRLPVMAVLTVLAAWRNRPAALPLIVLLSLPAVWVSALVLLLATPRLVAQNRKVDDRLRGERVVQQPVALRGR